MGSNYLVLDCRFVPNDRRLWVGHLEWRWLVEGQECLAKEFVHQRLVFLVVSSGWADGTPNKGAQPGDKGTLNPCLPFSSELYTRQWRVGRCLSLIYAKVPKPVSFVASLLLPQTCRPPAHSPSSAPAVIKRLLSCPIRAESLPRNRALPLSCDRKRQLCFHLLGSFLYWLSLLTVPRCLRTMPGNARSVPRGPGSHASVCCDPNTNPAPTGPNREMVPWLSPPGELGSLKLSYSLLLTLLSSFPSAAY